MSKKDGSITPETVLKTSHTYLDLKLLEQELTKLKGALVVDDSNIQAELVQYTKYGEALGKLETFKMGGIEKIKKEHKEHQKHLQKLVDSYNTPFIIPSIDHDWCFLKIYQPELHGNTLTNKKPYVRHYGIDPEHTKGLVGHIIAKDILHPIEYQLLIEAAKILGKHCASEVFVNTATADRPYANNVLLVDIFPRKQDSTDTVYISLDSKVGGPETHTVVLWRTKENELTLIDPTNEKCSHFLVGKTINGYQIISGQYPESQIYSNDIRNLKKEPRDCTDIAVKIAFELNERQLVGTNVDIVKNQAVDLISNQKIMSVPWKHLALNTWDLHSSVVDVRRENKKIVDEFLEFSPSISSIIDFKKIHTITDVENITSLLGELEGLAGTEDFL